MKLGVSHCFIISLPIHKISILLISLYIEGAEDQEEEEEEDECEFEPHEQLHMLTQGPNSIDQISDEIAV